MGKTWLFIIDIKCKSMEAVNVKHEYFSCHKGSFDIVGYMMLHFWLS